MKILSVKDNFNDNYYTKTFMLDEGIQIDSLISIIKQFESDNIELFVCHCRTFDENGNQLYKKFNKLEDIQKLTENSSPYIDFTIDFCNKQTMEYSFSLLTSTNSNTLTYLINKKKQEVDFQKGHARR